jgi:hypothetical protein
MHTYTHANIHMCMYTPNLQIPKGVNLGDIQAALPSILAALLIKRGALVPNASRHYMCVI